MFIYFDSDTAPEKGVQDTMTRAAMLAAEEEGLDQSRLELSVSFVSKDEIRLLNKQYRDKDAVTDVLSFPQFDSFDYLTDWGEINLGDVVICMAVAEEQAKEFGHSVNRELIYLFTHSIFHLLGYDHMEPEDKAEMREKEEKVMTALSLSR